MTLFLGYERGLKQKKISVWQIELDVGNWSGEWVVEGCKRVAL